MQLERPITVNPILGRFGRVLDASGYFSALALGVTSIFEITSVQLNARPTMRRLVRERRQ